MAGWVRHFNRYELKYLLPHSRLGELRERLAAYVHPDPHSPPGVGYPVYSVYCESASLLCFWEKVEGLKFRRKVRFRRYGDAPFVFLEIKQRIDRTLQKRRTRWPLERAAEVFFSGPPDRASDLSADDRVVEEIAFLWRHYRLRPSMGISYRREAYLSRHQPDLRITVDRRVRYHPCEPTLVGPEDPSKCLIDPDQVILEVKFDHAVPLWLCKVIGAMGLQVVRLSKYCTAVDRERFGGALTGATRAVRARREMWTS